MPDVARDPAALDQLRAQRDRLADRMRPPWWGWAGAVVVWALVFAGPFRTRYFPPGAYWALVVAAVAVGGLVQWGVARVTGIRMGFRDLLDRQGRATRIATLVVSLAALAIETLLIDHHGPPAAVVVAALAVGAEVLVQLSALREFREELRGGGLA